MKLTSLLVLFHLCVGTGTLSHAEDAVRKPDGMEVFNKAVGRIYCGSQPLGEDSFKEMARLGVKLAISVDGAVPDVAAAKANGIRYIHLPIGYDSVPPDVVVALSEALKQTDGQVFIHCHHGKHRGPAATAIAAMIDGTMDSTTALNFLSTAGTSKDYSGLWRDVREFKQVPSGVKAAPLVEVAKVEPVAEAMVAVDEALDKLNGLLKPGANATSPPDEASATSMLLLEGMRESKRHSEFEKRPDDLIKAFTAAETQTLELHDLLKKGDREKAAALFSKIKQDCKSCHKQFRDR